MPRSPLPRWTPEWGYGVHTNQLSSM
jgi:hypothetical protein